jgi:hypothetical protein
MQQVNVTNRQNLTDWAIGGEQGRHPIHGQCDRCEVFAVVG